MEDRHAIRDVLDVPQVVGRHENGAALVPEAGNKLPCRPPRLGVHARGRLVQDQDLGLADEGEGQGQALPLAARQPANPRPGNVPEPHDLEERLGVATAVVEPGVQVEHIARRGSRVEAAALEHEAQPGLEGRTAPGRVLSQDPGLAGIGRTVALEDLDRGGLAGPVRSEEGEELAGCHGQGYAVEDVASPVSLDDAPEGERRGGLAHGALEATGPEIAA